MSQFIGLPILVLRKSLRIGVIPSIGIVINLNQVFIALSADPLADPGRGTG